MNRESIEELRQRLLADSQVRDMIAMRAYEIYQRRGGEPGSEAEDWFRAEHEILSFLIVEESRRAEEEARQAHQASEAALKKESRPSSREEAPPTGSVSIDEQGEGPRSFEPRTTPEIAERPEASGALTAAERARSQSELGAWSATEPESAERAPDISPEAPKEKKAARKTAARKPRVEVKDSEPKKATTRKSTKKTATAKEDSAKEVTAKKPATRKAPSKKSDEDKPKKKK